MHRHFCTTLYAIFLQFMNVAERRRFTKKMLQMQLRPLQKRFLGSLPEMQVLQICQHINSLYDVSAIFFIILLYLWSPESVKKNQNVYKK